MEYCSHVWGGAFPTTLKCLDRVQKRAIRLIANSSLTDRLDSLQHRRNVADLTIFYKYNMDVHAPEEIKSILPYAETFPCNTRHSRNAHPFTVSLTKSRTVAYQRDFFNRVAPIWNSLEKWVFPDEFNPQSFKTNVHVSLKQVN
jgi:hypothetical protein